MKDPSIGPTNPEGAVKDTNRMPAGKSIPLRLGLIAAGLLVFQTGFSIWLQAESFWNPVTMLFSTAFGILGISCLVFAMLSDPPRRSEWFILAALLGGLWGAAFGDRMNYSPFTISHTDNEMIGEYSAEALEFGYNPYTWNFTDAMRVFRDGGLRVTTFLDGSTQHRVTYPALPTLLLVTLRHAGLGQARSVGLIFHSVLLVLIFFGTPGKLRPLIALPLFASRDFVSFTLSGLQDVVWSTILVAMVLAWRRPTLRAIFFGLACAYRQQPWILAPFLLIYLWNAAAQDRMTEKPGSGQAMNHPRHGPRSVLTDPRLKEISYFVAVSIGVFLLINLPFMLWNFRAWILGVFEPVYAAFNMYSHGLGTLSQYGLLPYPRGFYTSLQLSAYAIMLMVQWRHPRWVAQAFWVFPGIFFWLYYRGLANYWLYWIPPLLIALVHDHKQPFIITKDQPRWQWTAAIVVVILAANLVWGAILLQRPPAVTASLSYPMESTNGNTITRLSLDVTNASDREFRPRFSVQREGTQPLPWDIAEGPERLMSGVTAHYAISPYAASRDFSASRGAQVVISDARNDYGLRAVIDVPGQPSFASPDLIVNPTYGVWLSDQGWPAGWYWFPSEVGLSRPLFETLAGRSAVILPADGGTTRLSQTVTFPDSISIWVRPAAGEAGTRLGAYGLEFQDGQHRLWVLFGDREGVGNISPSSAVMYMRAPINQWSRQTIFPPELYRQFGWALPDYSVRNRQGIEFAARQVMLSLLVSDTHQAQAFGAIEQDPHFASSRSLVAEALAHPDDYYVNLGNEYCRQRNTDLARQAYLIALEYNPDSIAAGRGLESCQ